MGGMMTCESYVAMKDLEQMRRCRRRLGNVSIFKDPDALFETYRRNLFEAAGKPYPEKTKTGKPTRNEKRNQLI